MAERQPSVGPSNRLRDYATANQGGDATFPVARENVAVISQVPCRLLSLEIELAVAVGDAGLWLFVWDMPSMPVIGGQNFPDMQRMRLPPIHLAGGVATFFRPPSEAIGVYRTAPAYLPPRGANASAELEFQDLYAKPFDKGIVVGLSTVDTNYSEPAVGGPFGFYTARYSLVDSGCP